jgi:hypothetical protein
MKKTVRIVAAAAAVAAGMGLTGLAVATETHAQPGPLPTWCPGEFWDPGWGNNWDGGGCHDNFRGGWGGGPHDNNFDRHDNNFDRHDNNFGPHDGWGHR